MVKIQASGENTTLYLMPNRSIEWSEALPWIVIISLPCAGIAIGWFLFGVWAILPFAGIEIALLTFVMYRTCYFNHRQQRITIDGDNIHVSSGVRPPLQEHSFPRDTCRQVIRESASHCTNLILQSQGKEIEIAFFLTEAEKKEVSQALLDARIPKVTEQLVAICT